MSVLLSFPTTLSPPASLPGRDLLAGTQERISQQCQNHPRVPIPHVTLSHMVFAPPTETQPWEEGTWGGKDVSALPKGSYRELCWTPEHTELSTASLTTSDTHSDW